MKKVILFALLAIATSQCIAQKNNGGWSLSDYVKPRPKADFNYLKIYKNITLRVELNDLKEINCLPNIDSLLEAVKKDLQYLSDSLKDDAVVRKLEYTVYPKRNVIKITTYTNNSNSFVVQSNELKLLKTDQDTLAIKIPVFTGDSTNHYTGNIKSKVAIQHPVYVKFYVNNLKDIIDLKVSVVSICINDIKEKILDKKIAQNTSPRMNDKIGYLKNSAFEKDVLNYWNIKNKNLRKELVPTIGFGFQNANAAWFPSFNYGLRYGRYEYSSEARTYWYLTLDNYYNFYQDALGNNIKDNYKFLTLKHTSLVNDKSKGFQLNTSASLGYMISKKGNLFEPNTFKMTIPSIKNGWLSIEPELFFNDFFKNPTLSLKLAINYE